MDFPFPLFPVFFVVMWVGVAGLLSHTGGWARLSEKYRCDDSFIGTWKGWQWGKIGGINYKRCLWIAAAPEGLYIKTGPLFLFRAFHPPLLIPWSAIKSVEERKYWWMRVLDINLNASDVQIMLEQHALSEGQRFLGDKLNLLGKTAPK